MYSIAAYLDNPQLADCVIHTTDGCIMAHKIVLCGNKYFSDLFSQTSQNPAVTSHGESPQQEHIALNYSKKAIMLVIYRFYGASYNKDWTAALAEGARFAHYIGAMDIYEDYVKDIRLSWLTSYYIAKNVGDEAYASLCVTNMNLPDKDNIFWIDDIRSCPGKIIECLRADAAAVGYSFIVAVLDITPEISFVELVRKFPALGWKSLIKEVRDAMLRLVAQDVAELVRMVCD